MTFLIKAFPLLAITGAVAGYLAPSIVAPAKPAIVPLLMLVMLSMGLTLTSSDFLEVKKYKRALLAGFILQFSVMPLTALLLSLLFKLPNELTVGMLLVGSVAGGTASNVMTYLANGHVALSVSMTAISTLASVLLTPLLLLLLANSSMDIPATSMLISLVKIVLLPVGLGVFINQFFAHSVTRIKPLLAPFAVFSIVFIISIVVALNAHRLETVTLLIIVVPLLHNLLGMLFGYWAAVLLNFDRRICKTMAIEVGMQNSGLATALALKFFSPMTAIPAAVFSIWLNITGAIFAGLSRNKD